MTAAVSIYVLSLSLICELYILEMPFSEHLLKQLNSIVKSQGWLLTVVCYATLHPKKNMQVAISCAILTINWFIFTRMFNFVQITSKYCINDIGTLDRSQCELNGLNWYNGFDISGHVFLLSFAVLLLHSSLLKSHQLERSQSVNFTMSLARSFSIVYLIYCVFMLSITSLYFHTIYQKAVALLCSVLSFWFLKKFVYL